MTPVRALVRIACIGLLTANLAAPAAGLDRIGQTSVASTRLGQLIADHLSPSETAPGTASYWQAVVMAIAKADPEDDVQADARAGHAGLMTYANDTVVERHVASGLRCRDRSEPRRRTVFHFGYRAPLSPDAGKALLAFDTYARAYNLQALSSGILQETSCIPIGE